MNLIPPLRPGSSPPRSPRYGTVIPNRIFVGGISPTTNEEDLATLFEEYGRVRASKIIYDRSGISKGYGFVTFESKEEADRVIRDLGTSAEGVVLKDRKLNVAQAIKKAPIQTFSPYGEQVVGGLLGSREAIYQAPFQLIVPSPAQAMIVPPYQYSQLAPSTTGCQHLVYGNEFYPYLPAAAQSVAHVSGAEYQTQPVAEQSPQAVKFSKQAGAQSSSNSEYSSCSPQGRTCVSSTVGTYRYSASPSGIPSPMHPQTYQLHHVLPTKAGMAIMAYPSSIVVGTPIVHVKDSTGTETDMMTELGFLHSPLQSPAGTGTLTPPPTPLAPIPCDFGSNGSIEARAKN